MKHKTIEVIDSPPLNTYNSLKYSFLPSSRTCCELQVFCFLRGISPLENKP